MKTKKSEEAQLAHCLMSGYFSVVLFLFYWNKKKTEVPLQKHELLSELGRLFSMNMGAVEKIAAIDRSKIYETVGKLLQEFLNDTSNDNRVEKNHLIAFVGNDILDQKLLIQSFHHYGTKIGILGEMERIFVAYPLVMQILESINPEAAECLSDFLSLDQKDEEPPIPNGRNESTPNRDSSTNRSFREPKPRPEPTPESREVPRIEEKPVSPLIAYQPLACHSENDAYIDTLKVVHDEFLSKGSSFDRGYMEYLITKEIFPDMNILEIRERCLKYNDFLQFLKQKLRDNFLRKVQSSG